MLTSTESGWRSASSAAVSGVRSVPVVKTVTEKSRDRACATIDRKSRRMNTSPPESVRKNVPAAASSSNTRRISSRESSSRVGLGRPPGPRSEEVAPHEHLAARERHEERAGRGQLVEHPADLLEGELLACGLGPAHRAPIGGSGAA